MEGVTSARFAGGASVITTNRQATSVDAEVPAAATTGVLQVSDSFLRTVGQSADPFTVGVDSVVPEIEPNEDNPAATPMGPRTRGSGTLAGPADRDHFVRGCFMPGATYNVTVQPRVVGVVFVNGAPVTLDVNGRGQYQAATASLVFGLTGGNGDYTLTVDFVHL